MGARPVEAVPGALTFAAEAERSAFRELLGALGRRGLQRLAFVVPAQATWSIAAYELALLTAAERDARALEGVELFLVTHESAPLELLGAAATQLVAEKLEEAGVQLQLSRSTSHLEGGDLCFRDGGRLEVDHAVALPALEVPRIPGLPQRPRGFVRTDTRMNVDGLDDVWAAGDVTSFPIKQGGLAAQQADVAAGSIAARAGVHAPARMFQPVLRAALITGGPLEFLRSDGPGGAGAAAGAQALWWPPMKVAGTYLGPLLAQSVGEEGEGEMLDLEPSSDPAADEAERESATKLVLAAADADAIADDFESALRWLTLIEQLNLVLPPSYAAKRFEWRHQLDPDLAPDAVAGRVDPSFISAEAGISDLHRRLGWFRAMESSSEREMAAHLAELDAGLEHLRSLSRQSGVLPSSGQRRSPSRR